MTKLLDIQNLSVFFSIEKQTLAAVRDISFSLSKGESLGIVGESGAGKSALLHAITKLSSATHFEGHIFFQGTDLLSLPEKELQKIRGKNISMIFQDPMNALNPTMKIGRQIEEVLLIHTTTSKEAAKKRVLEWLFFVGIDRPQDRFHQYPHELSGGQKQRVLIAIALILKPDLILADEPTTALDRATQSQILDLLKKMQKQFHMSLILISHDFDVVSKVCDRILVLYGGKVVEEAKTEDILTHPKHPYTQGLLASIPRMDFPKNSPLKAIEGSPPSPFEKIEGCPFEKRCPYRMEICKKEPPLIDHVACWRDV